MFLTRDAGNRLSRTRRRDESPVGLPPSGAFVAFLLLLAALATPGVANVTQPADGQAKSTDQPTSDTDTAEGPVGARRADRPPRMFELDRQINEALQGKGEGAKLSPLQVLALLQRKYEIERNTREWEMLDLVGYHRWRDLARRVAKKYPEVMRCAAAGESAVAREYQGILGELGGKENLALLIARCDAKPSWSVVAALGNSGSRQAWPALRKVVSQRLVTDNDLNLANLALDFLSRAGDKAILPTLRRWLDSDDARKQRMAMAAAAQLGAKEFAADLRRADPKVLDRDRKLLHRALVSCGDDKYLDEVHAQARDESEYLRKSQERPPDPAMLIRVWNYTQNRALDAIAKLGSPRSLPLLDKLRKKAADKRIRKRSAAIAGAIRTATKQRSAPQVSR